MTEAERYSGLGGCFACVQKRADGVAGLPWELQEGDRPTDLPPGFTNLLWLAEASLCLFGASYWQIAGGLRYLNPVTMRVARNSRGIVRFEQWIGDNQPISFDPAEVVYIRHYNPTDDLGPGISPMQAAAEPSGLGVAANRTLRHIFSAPAMGGYLVLRTERVVPDTELDRIKTQWERVCSGDWRTVILRGGVDATILRPDFDGKTIAGLMAIGQNQVCAAFGVPVALLGVPTLYDGDPEYRRGFYYDVLLPEARRIMRAANRQYFEPRGQELGFRLSMIPALQRDRGQAAAAYVELQKLGVLTIDEVRRRVL